MPLGANTRSQSGWFAGLLLEVGTIFVHKVARGGGAMGGAIRYLYLPTYWRGTCSFVSRGRDLLGLLLLTVRPMQLCRSYLSIEQYWRGEDFVRLSWPRLLCCCVNNAANAMLAGCCSAVPLTECRFQQQLTKNRLATAATATRLSLRASNT